MPRTTTLESHLQEDPPRGAAEGVGSVLLELAAGVRAIAAVLARAVVCGAVAGIAGDGEPRTRMEGLANDLLVDACTPGGQVSAVVSPELEEPHPVFGRQAAPFLLAMTPLDGASNLCVNVTAGTIFSVLRRPAGAAPGAAAFLQEGARQVAAGYALYGPCTMLVVTTGRDVLGFTLDEGAGAFVLTHPDLRVPEQAGHVAVEAASARNFDRAIRRYVDECVAGASGPRGADFDVRWVGSAAAEVHRVLVRGGTFLAPRDASDPERRAKLRLLYEASPLALLVERAGGAATTGSGRLLEVVPRDPHERVPAVLGSRAEVERIAAYHADPDGGVDRPYKSPLFNVRSLLRET
ncbi:MAG TPA: class 1 fructose-bisphosphatase [Anaeromyxobacter sp.]|nr:class 1 fructose-bisphosphatase [Anaeromyxobacter sp.]